MTRQGLCNGGSDLSSGPEISFCQLLGCLIASHPLRPLFKGSCFTPGMPLPKCLIVVGYRGLVSLPQYRTDLKSHPGSLALHEFDWGLCWICIEAQLLSAQSTFSYLFTGMIPKGIPKLTFCIHISMSESATQGIWPKTASPRENTWSEIWKMRRSHPCTGPGWEQRQNSWSRGGAFEFQGKERKPMQLSCPNSYSHTGME